MDSISEIKIPTKTQLGPVLVCLSWPAELQQDNIGWLGPAVTVYRRGKVVNMSAVFLSAISVEFQVSTSFWLGACIFFSI